MACFLRLASSKVLKAAGAGLAAVATAVGVFEYKTNTVQNQCKSLLSAYDKFPPMADYPDLRKHNNCLANHLTPTLYSKLRNKVSTTLI